MTGKPVRPSSPISPAVVILLIDICSSNGDLLNTASFIPFPASRNPSPVLLISCTASRPACFKPKPLPPSSTNFLYASNLVLYAPPRS